MVGPALAVVALYCLAIASLSLPVIYASFPADAKLGELVHMYAEWGYWAWVGVMGLCQACLLLLPVRAAEGRPARRGALFLPVFAASLLMGVLVFSAIGAVAECFNGEKIFDPPWQGTVALFLTAAAWAAWAWIFSRPAGPAELAARQVKHLRRGSLLELLVAVPTHIVVRGKDYCCAGFMTFMGITFGLSVLLISFGPGVYFLFSARKRTLEAA